jgi:hypothetical protein
MRSDVMGLLYEAAMAAKSKKNDYLACAVLELGNNLQLLMRGEGSLDEFNLVYTGVDREPFDIEAILPVRGVK